MLFLPCSLVTCCVWTPSTFLSPLCPGLNALIKITINLSVLPNHPAMVRGCKVWHAGTIPGQCWTRVTLWLLCLSLLETTQESCPSLLHHPRHNSRLFKKKTFQTFRFIFHLCFPWHDLLMSSETLVRGIYNCFVLNFLLLTPKPCWEHTWKLAQHGVLSRNSSPCSDEAVPQDTPYHVFFRAFVSTFSWCMRSHAALLGSICGRHWKSHQFPFETFSLTFFFPSSECASGLSFGGLVVNAPV